MRRDRGHGEAGYTLLELLVAAALMAMLTATTCSMLVDAKAMFETAAERAGLHQGARVAVDRLTSGIGRAGAGAFHGDHAGGLVRWMPPVWPGRADRAPRPDAITAVAVVPDVPPAVLAFDAPVGATALDFARTAACALPCGFVERMTVLVFDGRGSFDLFVLTATDGASAAVRRLPGGTGASYPRGSPVLPAEVHTYYWNSAAAELRVHDGDRGDFPVVDHVVGLAFEYFGDPSPPKAPRPPPGEANCLYDESGAVRRGLDALVRSGGTIAPLVVEQLSDGPWCGSGDAPFDADLLRIRGVRVTMRLEAASAAHRGADARWFRNPGAARDSRTLVKDVVLDAAIVPRNLGGWR